jgi:fibronectin-binding autotransporter adhesin
MVGSASSLGQPTTAANGIILFGTAANSTSTLEYLGAGNTTDRQIALAPIGTGDSSTHSATILNNGSGPLIFSASTFYISDTNATGSAGNRNLTLGGTYSGGVNEIQGIISTNGGLVRKVNLTKAADASTWRLLGTNNYDGTTTVNGGALLIMGDSSAVTNVVTVSTNATFGGTGTVGGTVRYRNGSLAQFTVGSPMTFTKAAFLTNVTVKVDLGTALGNGTYVLATN